MQKPTIDDLLLRIKELEDQLSHTKLQELHDELELTKNRFHTYVKRSPIGIFLTNEEKQFLYVNPAAGELLNYSPEQMLNLSFPEIVADADNQKVYAGFTILKDTAQISDFNLQLQRSDGSMLDVLIDGAKISETQFVLFVKDVTDLVNTEIQLKEQNEEYEAVNEELRQTNEELIEAQETMLESELQYKQLFENLEQGFALHKMIYDKEGNPVDYTFILMNNAFERLTGIDAKKFIGHTVTEMLPNIEDVWIENYGRVAKTGKSYHFESYSADLDKFYDVVAYAPKIDHFAVIFTDVTSVKRSQKQLIEAKQLAEESEARFKALHNASFGGIFLHYDSIIFDCNQGLTEITGYSYDELIGMNGLDLIAKRYRPIIIEHIKRRGEEAYEAVAVSKSGEEYPVRLEARNIPYKGKMARTVEVRDITEQKAAESALHESETHFRTLADSGLAMVWAADENKQCNYVNKPWLDFTGQTPEHEMREGWMENMHPDDHNNFLSRFTRAFDQGQKFTCDYRLRNANGAYRWIQNVASPRYSSNGQFIGFIAHCIDITERKKAEQDLIEAKEMAEKVQLELQIKNQEYEALNEELRQTNEELFEAKEHAEESDRLKSAFLNNISHEFRTPMNGILGFAELFLRPKKNDEQRRKYAGIMRENCNRLLDIVTDTVEISALQSNVAKVNIEKCNLTTIFEESLSEIKLEAQKKGLEVRINNNCENIDYFLTDRYKLQRAVMHLLNNAVKFTSQGYINFSCEKEKDRVHIKISDTGIGIPVDVKEKLFEPYKQSTLQNTLNYGGTGIGLALVKSYIDLLEGNIAIQSELGKGTTVEMTIPAWQTAK
jgi:PAS domain S-box-containing protein